jgi:tetratricopeptide (TPR) repeat protein
MKAKKKAEAGDILLIPLDGVSAAAKVLYVSGVFKDTMLLGVYPLRLTDPVLPPSLPDSFALVVYTLTHAVKKGTWRKVGHAPLGEHEKGRSLRIVGADVWLGDEVLRKATADDKQSIPGMGIIYDPEDEIKIALGLETLAAIAYRGGLRSLKEDDPGEAISYLNVAIREDPQYAQAYWARAQAFEQTGDAKKAKADKKEALRLDPSLTDDG